MAVQAQYPSNVLLFNRNGQESNSMLGIGINNYMLLQPPSQPAVAGTPAAAATTTAAGAATFILDQSHNHINGGAGAVHHHHNNTVTNNSNNPRKRGREALTTATTTTTSTTAAAKNPFTFSLQDHHHHNHNHHHQLIQLSQLHQHQLNAAAVVSTGLKLSFGDQQIQQQQQQLLRNYNAAGTSSCSHNNNNPNPNHASLSSSVNIVESLLPDDILANHFNKQSDEINHFILAQGEHLRRTISEKRQRHYQTLLSTAESSITRRLREKEAELEKASRRHAELEARAAQLGAESQLWQAKARAQEVQAASLQAQLHQAMMAAAGNSTSKPQAQLDLDGGEAEDAESAYVDPDRVVETSPACGGLPPPGCRACGMRTATVVILPCRHMCLCLECDGVVQACPVCSGIRNSSVEVYLT